MTGPWLSACASSNCVQVRRNGDLVQIRDSTLGDASPVSCMSAGRFAGYLEAIRSQAAEYLWRWCASAGLEFDAEERAAFRAGVRAGRFDDLTADWRSAVSTVADPGTETHDGSSPASVDDSAHCGPVPVDVHPAVRAVLDVTPINEFGHVITRYEDNRWRTRHWGDPAPIAAKQAAAVLREHAEWLRKNAVELSIELKTWPHLIRSVAERTAARADTIDPTQETTQP